MNFQKTSIHKVCVYCASSNQANEIYINSAKDLGKILAQNNISIVYGGGSRGLMGYLADSALENGGEVIGIIPGFMVEQEWAHKNISELVIVKTMHERKAGMIKDTDAVIALPGGSGTLEELFEVITLKRLALYHNPIVLINILGFYNHLLSMFDRMIEDKFLDSRHRQILSIADRPDEVLRIINETAIWDKDALSFAAL